jgi:hypothetical protein
VHVWNKYSPPVIKHLRRGCVRVHRDTGGTPYRWTITSLAFKGEHDPTGVSATWIIGEPAARAVEVLQRLRASPSDVEDRHRGSVARGHSGCHAVTAP